MAKTKSDKVEILEHLMEDLKKRVIALMDYQGLSAEEISELRDSLFEQDYKMTVIKNTLLRKAAKELGLTIVPEADKLPLAIIVSEDEVGLAKLIEKFAGGHEKATIVGAWVDSNFIDREAIAKLSKLPGKEEILAKLVGSINAPISGFVNTLAGNLRGLVSVINQYSQKKQ